MSAATLPASGANATGRGVRGAGLDLAERIVCGPRGAARWTTGVSPPLARQVADVCAPAAIARAAARLTSGATGGTGDRMDR